MRFLRVRSFTFKGSRSPANSCHTGRLQTSSASIRTIHVRAVLACVASLLLVAQSYLNTENVVVCLCFGVDVVERSKATGRTFLQKPVQGFQVD